MKNSKINLPAKNLNSTMKQRVVQAMFLLFGCLMVTNLQAQKEYVYEVDLTNVVADMIKVELTTPKIKQSEIIFYMPKVIPGTYKIADYGRFVHKFKALDKKGQTLKTEKLDNNSWKINDSKKLRKITYWVEDTFDTKLVENSVFEPAGTNIEKGENFVLNASGVFGYFKGKKNMRFDLNITRNTEMYGATGLISNGVHINLNRINSENIKEISETQIDLFSTENYNDLVDSPIMYTKDIDTTFIKIANTDILISSYSPNKVISSKEIAATIKEILIAQKEYLGGTLPVEKYAFIFYFDEDPPGQTGALEHSYSSVYYIKERPIVEMKQWLRNVAAHEFFHIVTPLNIHSEEIQYFNYNDPKMSKHLWLYEGVTEYFASNMQVKGNLITKDQYLNVLRGKIINSFSRYKNDLSFTEFSKAVLDNPTEFGNVYQKGALIGMCLDIKLRKLSEGSYGMQNLVRDLAEKFGKNRPFKDDELFNHITKITYPEIGEFLNKYVDQNNPLPLNEVFDLVGITYVPKKPAQKFSIGLTDESVGLHRESGKFFIEKESALDEFGKALGLQQDDILLEMNGEEVPELSKLMPFITNLRESMENLENKNYSIKVIRKTIDNVEQEVLLTSKVFKIDYQIYHSVNYSENASKEQLKIREAWLTASK